MTYPDSVRFLYSLGNEVKTAKYGLERIVTVARLRWEIRSGCRASCMSPAPMERVRRAP